MSTNHSFLLIVPVWSAWVIIKIITEENGPLVSYLLLLVAFLLDDALRLFFLECVVNNFLTLSCVLNFTYVFFIFTARLSAVAPSTDVPE